MMPRRNNSVSACAAMIVCAVALPVAGCAGPLAFSSYAVQDDQQTTKRSGEVISPTTRAPSTVAANDSQPTPTGQPPQPQSPPVQTSAAYAPPPAAPTMPPPAQLPIALPTSLPPTGLLPGGLLPGGALSANPAGADPRELTALIDEVQGLGALDPEAQRGLLNDLKQCDPKLWPQLVRQFKIALAYRKQMAEAAATKAGVAEPATKPAVEEGSATIRPVAAASQSAAGSNSTAKSSLTATPTATPSATPAAGDVQVASNSQPAVAQSVGTKTPSMNSSPSGPGPTVATKSTANPSPLETPSTPSPANTSAKPATPPAANSAPPDAWQTQLTTTILELESQTAGGGATPADIDRQLNLRLLYLAAGRRDDAMRPISGMSPDQQQFWTKELYGLATLRDAAKEPDLERRATAATLHLRQAAVQLGDLAAPVVKNVAFCKEVTSFGVYTKFVNYEFAAGDEALLYCELENLKATSTDRGYHTAVKGSYELLDAHGLRVAEQEFPVSDDFCANPRRDFFILYHIWVPKQVAPGSYTLQLTIEDTQTNKIGQSAVQFKVK